MVLVGCLRVRQAAEQQSRVAGCHHHPCLPEHRAVRKEQMPVLALSLPLCLSSGARTLSNPLPVYLSTSLAVLALSLTTTPRGQLERD